MNIYHLEITPESYKLTVERVKLVIVLDGAYDRGSLDNEFKLNCVF